jgi:hypothetical protein
MMTNSISDFLPADEGLTDQAFDTFAVVSTPTLR